MGRLTLFLKGNLDVHDSLHSFRLGGKLVWNGINEVLRAGHPGRLARVTHETATRTDALRLATGIVPDAVRSRSLPLGAYPLESQFSRAIYETKADAIILSIVSDVIFRQVRHKRDGFLLYLYAPEAWSPEERQWLKTEFEPVPRPEAADNMANFAAIIAEIRRGSEAPILIYNMSPIVPGESLHCHRGVGETLSTRIRRFNLGLFELSAATGISIIDVDSIVARNGADALKLDVQHLTAAGYQLVAKEVVRVLEDLGVLDAE
jgi:hypothetical protein